MTSVRKFFTLPSLVFVAVVAAAMALFGAVLATPASAQGDANIVLMHGIPGVDVDVEAGGENVIEGFSFGDMEDLSALSGATLEGLKVKVAGTEDVAIDAGDTALPASGNYTIVAHLDEAGTPTLAVFENDTSAIDAGNGRLVVRHVAAAPAVDVLAGDAVAFANVTNPNEGSLDLAAGTITASVVPTGATEPVVIGPADLPIGEGASLIVYAVGSLEGETLTVLTQSITGLGSAPAAVNTGNSPVEPLATAGPSMLVIALLAVVGLGALGAGAGLAHATNRR